MAGAVVPPPNAFEVTARVEWADADPVGIMRYGAYPRLLDLAEAELGEAAILEAYQPKQLDDEELASLVDEAVNATGATSMAQMGQVMKEATAKAAGRADGKRLSEAVKARLGAN